MKLGDYCRAKNGAPARYVTDDLCVYVSAQDNDVFVAHVGDGAPNPALPHVGDEALLVAAAMLRYCRLAARTIVDALGKDRNQRKEGP
jgi:hypothetical protein